MAERCLFVCALKISQQQKGKNIQHTFHPISSLSSESDLHLSSSSSETKALWTIFFTKGNWTRLTSACHQIGGGGVMSSQCRFCELIQVKLRPLPSDTAELWPWPSQQQHESVFSLMSHLWKKNVQKNSNVAHRKKKLTVFYSLSPALLSRFPSIGSKCVLFSHSSD